MHKENEGEDIGNNVENGGAIECGGGGIDISELHLRAPFAFFHGRGFAYAIFRIS